MRLPFEALEKNGFSLIELMVVVAIIGVLATIAIPNFRTYRAKTRTTEAKLHLSHIWAAEETHRSEYDVYGSCIARMGVSQAVGNYYAYGFDSTAAFGPTECQANTAVTAFDATKTTSSTPSDVAKKVNLINSDITSNGAQFTAEAAGIINIAGNNARFDRWTVNEEKIIANIETQL